ncbi:hypothetical protein [Psychrobacter sp. FDAARGOS_221]|uniref:hypothetical protein n=1 Tax=Psychrobacter sp. FDAARGOS_221 TaxID=1975705 RepID=UPI000BB55C89|nr:hypothetical protein [Psychrobacter sp. FDAARGOS_221]PNK60845.1 hypothetical protein A6J60_008110 [Psychrobacter sp. FDAARGOS_221]
MVGFQQFKIQVIETTGLERDALHIYVGISVFLISLMLTKPLFRRYLTRLNIALLMATFFALLGEYLDLSHNYPHITGDHLEASIHDILNTCFWPYMLYAINRWTSLFDKQS